jgi:hypothetical protein
VGEDWVRPYSPGVGRWLVIGWEAIAFALLGWASVGLFRVEGNGVTYLAMTLAALWVVGGWRILEMGVYVRPDGLQIRGLLRSRRLGWDEIAHVRLHRHTNKIGRWEIEGGMTVLIERRDGSMVNTELWAQGVDFHNRPHLFRAVYQDLRTRHLEAKASGT